MLLLLAASALAGLPAGYALLDVGGADDDCCAQKVAAALDALPFVGTAAVSYESKQACASLTGPMDAAAIGTALTAAGYSGTNIRVVAACPEGLTPKPADPWAAAEGLDVKLVSHGETIDLPKVLAPGKFTIVDFGATWCGPCFTAAERITTYLRTHPDTAVRAVLLDGADAKASFAQPIVKQHLQWAEGLPYFLVYGPTGKQVYKGSDVDALLAAIDGKRK